MSERRWLPAVLKARQAAEDQAAQQVAAAQLHQQDVLEQAAAERARLDGLGESSPLTTQVFLATAAAHRAAAATHAAAHHRIEFAERALEAKLDTLRSAARERRSAEKLDERQVAEAKVAELSLAQRELDDLTVTRWGRNETA